MADAPGDWFEVKTVRSALAPRWWQVGIRLRRWRFERDARRARAALSPVARAAVEEFDRRIEHVMLFGSEDLTIVRLDDQR